MKHLSGIFCLHIGRTARISTILATVLLVAFSANLQAQNEESEIQQKLNATFKLTTTTPDRSDIATPGDIVQILKPGLLMYSVGAPMPPLSTYKNDKIGQGWAGFGRDLGGTMLAPGGQTMASYPRRQVPAGEKCWVISVNAQKDSVVFRLYSDPFDDTRYYADLRVLYPNKKEIPSVDNMMQLISQVLTVVPQEAAVQNQTPAVVQQPEQPMAPIAPPPPPPDAAPAINNSADAASFSVAVGDKREKVIQALGEPQKIIKLPNKEIDIYRDFRVIYIKDTVSSVQ